MGNYSFKTSGLPEPVGGVIEGHNFTQGAPHTVIYAGQSGLTFRNCNLTNCDVPVDSVIDKCNRTQISWCSHLHDSWFLKGFITECAGNCSHVTVIDSVTIDGVLMDTAYTYLDKVV